MSFREFEVGESAGQRRHSTRSSCTLCCVAGQEYLHFWRNGCRWSHQLYVQIQHRYTEVHFTDILTECDLHRCCTFLVQKNAYGFSWSLKEICHQTVWTTPCVCCLGRCVVRSNLAAPQPQRQLIWPLCLQEWIPRVLFIMTVLWLLCHKITLY